MDDIERHHLEVLAGTLEASGRYRILRKLEPRSAMAPPPETKLRKGLFVDIETTGLDPARCEIIELAMVPFTYGLGGSSASARPSTSCGSRLIRSRRR